MPLRWAAYIAGFGGGAAAGLEMVESAAQSLKLHGFSLYFDGFLHAAEFHAGIEAQQQELLASPPADITSPKRRYASATSAASRT